MIDAFRRMSESILSFLGEDAFYDGATVPTKINIEHGVQLTGMDGDRAEYRGDLTVNRDVATITSDVNPQAGKRFVQNGVTYRLEFLLQDNGVNKCFVILRVPP